MAKNGLTIKKSFCMANSRFFGLHGFSRFDFFSNFFSGDCHGSVEVRKTLFKALRTSVGAELNK